MSEPDPYRRPQGEQFEVVLCKKDINPLKASPEDFIRVPVVANDPTEACQHADVVKKAGEGFNILQASKSMVPTDYEHMARVRSTEGAPFDKTKI